MYLFYVYYVSGDMQKVPVLFQSCIFSHPVVNFSALVLEAFFTNVNHAPYRYFPGLHATCRDYGKHQYRGWGLHAQSRRSPYWTVLGCLRVALIIPNDGSSVASNILNVARAGRICSFIADTMDCGSRLTVHPQSSKKRTFRSLT